MVNHQRIYRGECSSQRRALWIPQSLYLIDEPQQSPGAGSGTGKQSHKEHEHQYTCEICGIETFTEKSMLTEHFFSHKTDNPYRFSKLVYECYKCSKYFALKEDMLQHNLQKHKRGSVRERRQGLRAQHLNLEVVH